MGMRAPHMHRKTGGIAERVRPIVFREVARGDTTRAYRNRFRDGQWSHVSPGGEEHAGEWQSCTQGRCKLGEA